MDACVHKICYLHRQVICKYNIIFFSILFRGGWVKCRHLWLLMDFDFVWYVAISRYTNLEASCWRWNQVCSGGGLQVASNSRIPLEATYWRYLYPSVVINPGSISTGGLSAFRNALLVGINGTELGGVPNPVGWQRFGTTSSLGE